MEKIGVPDTFFDIVLKSKFKKNIKNTLKLPF